MNWLNAIKNLVLPQLKSGAHDSPQHGLCAMEMVAFMERLPHSDKPPCTCPVIAAFVRAINDRFSDTDRQRLLPYLPRLVGTVSPEHRVERAEYLVREVAHRLVAPLYHVRWPQHESAILRAQTMGEINTACAVADAAVADAAAYAAYADTRSKYAGVCLEILDGVLQIGPSAREFSYIELAKELEALS